MTTTQQTVAIIAAILASKDMDPAEAVTAAVKIVSEVKLRVAY